LVFPVKNENSFFYIITNRLAITHRLTNMFKIKNDLNKEKCEKIHMEKPFIETESKDTLGVFQEIKNMSDEKIIAEHIRVSITPHIKEAMCRLETKICFEFLWAHYNEFKYYFILADFINRKYNGNIKAEVVGDEKNKSLIVSWDFCEE